MPEESQALVPAQQTAPQRAPLRELIATIKDIPGAIDKYGDGIIQRELVNAAFDQDWRLAGAFAQSGFFTDAAHVAQAFTKLQLGRSWHMAEADAMKHIYLVNGKPEVQNEYVAAKMRDAGLDWLIDWVYEGDEVTGCKLWPSRLGPGGEYTPIVEKRNGELVPASVSFTKADAQRVKVKEDGKWITLDQKSTYQAYPQDLYFWKCIARLRRRYCTNILSGVTMSADRDETAADAATPAPAPTPLKVAVEEFTPTKTRARRAGKEEMPVTHAQETAQEPAPQATPAAEEKPAPVAQAVTSETKPAPVAQAAEASPPAQTEPSEPARANLLSQLKALRISRGDAVFVQQWTSLGTARTVEGMDDMPVEKLQKALGLLQGMAVQGNAEEAPAQAAPRKLF